MYGSCPDFVRFREKTFQSAIFCHSNACNFGYTKEHVMKEPVEMPDSEQDNLKNHAEESRWIKLAKAYQRIPVFGKLPAQSVSMFLAGALGILLAILFPQKECTCQDQFTDQKLEAMARQGNQAVRRYLAQKDNPINCAGRRLELLKELEKEKNKGHPKR